MKSIYLLVLLSSLSLKVRSQDTLVSTVSQTEMNKQLAQDFYQDLWFTNNTGNYAKYVASEYVVHDIGDRKGITEPAIQQKNIADFFWNNGDMISEIDYQIAEGDLVATRWTVTYKPGTIFGKVFLGQGNIPIINVFRIKNDKIAEIWNHRHDIDTGQTLKFVIKGFFIGLLFSLIPIFFAIRLKRKLKKVQVR